MGRVYSDWRPGKSARDKGTGRLRHLVGVPAPALSALEPGRELKLTPMERKTWHTDDKTSWGPGPWQDEPDKEQWPDEATGLPCLIVRNRFGALCGYVGVPEGHPWHGQSWDDIHADVHGGLTFAGHCQDGDPEEKTICHVPAPGEPDSVYWLGFDCAHAWDVSPGLEARDTERGWAPIRIPHSSYKTVSYVKAECARLAGEASR